MQYGTIELKRDINDILYLVVLEPNGPDRIYSEEDEYPNNSLFFNYPATISSKEATRRLIAKARKEIYNNIQNDLEILQDIDQLKIENCNEN